MPTLAFYGLFFLLVLVLYRLGTKPLALVAAGWALMGPRLLYLRKPVVGDRSFPAAGQADGIVSLLLTGGYPALTWVPFVIAGMAAARLDLAATAVRIRLALTGVALAVTGYGGSWLAPARLHRVRHRPRHPLVPLLPARAARTADGQGDRDRPTHSKGPRPTW
ncbi:hypothetical protein SVIO_004160 [Streptomyces violaceusniger]|uniref:Uncharacterized protein n=1 Tax=Streptomyces violaceusniger TaxID=68280 RepID=A0A4D4KVE5_STRVO|nr:hypothetical protein SVIO_004160 [Streptomyces violaceusniger]